VAFELEQGIWAVVAVVLSGAMYFLGSGLHPHWYLTWFAPLPLLLVAPRLRVWSAFLSACAAYAIGGMNMWQYLRGMEMPPGVVLLIVLGPAVFFGLIVLAFRRFALRGQLLLAMGSFPLLWVAFQYLQEFRSVHSTFGNLAYTQMDFVPVLQIASLTGIWGIGFLLFLFPAAVAVFFLAGTAVQKRRVATVAGLILGAALGYGVYRLHEAVDGPVAAPRVTVGLIATDGAKTLFPRSTGTLELVRQYAAHVPELTARGAQVVIIPEKIGRISGADLEQADAILEATAREQRVTISASFEHSPNLNETRLYSPDGTLEATYEKHHMLPPFESHLLEGTSRVSVERPSGRWGMQICKDMDFPQLSRQYGNDGAGLMLVPAWDFVTDGWLHGRMAILRGVESGFSIARAPKQGVLTVTDDRGRVLAERDTGSAPFATIVASVPVWNERTLYDRAGDWFAWLDLVLSAVLLASLFSARRSARRCGG
jgi:apolipoprotein N-acyltransferase